jgi:hypothetical protein
MLTPLHTQELQMRASTPRDRRPNVLDHSYNPETRHLDVTFHQGRRYRYFDVTPKQYEGLKAAHSAGGFLHRHIIGKCDASPLDD